MGLIKTGLPGLMLKISKLGVSDSDSDEVKMQKAISSFSLILGAIPVQLILGSIYYILDEKLTANILFGSSVITIVLLILHSVQKVNYGVFKFLTLATAFIAPFCSTILLGGMVQSSFVIMWGLVAPMFALVLYKPKQASFWFLFFCVLVVICVMVQPQFRSGNNIPQLWQTLIAAFNAIFIAGMVFGAVTFFVIQRDAAYKLLDIEKDKVETERAKAEHLLLNILPKDIAELLKNQPKVFADSYEDTSILFADIVNFTSLSADLKPMELVEILNEVFSHFDDLVENYGLEKIKTIGDCYMVAAGVPRARSDHAHAIAALAIDMQKYVDKRMFGGKLINFRIGINSGPVVAGVIGRKKFIYDLWGDAVNIASRMESSGRTGAIQITRSTFELIRNEFVCEAQPNVNVKGKGDTEVWHLKGSNVSLMSLQR